MSATYTYRDNSQAIHRAVKKAGFRNFSHASLRIMKDARASIIRRPPMIGGEGSGTSAAAPPGHPPYTRRGAIKRAIAFEASETESLIGVRFSILGDSAEPHEHGGDYMGEHYEPRSFMGPSLEKNEDRFAKDWTGSVHN